MPIELGSAAERVNLNAVTPRLCAPASKHNLVHAFAELDNQVNSKGSNIHNKTPWILQVLHLHRHLLLLYLHKLCLFSRLSVSYLLSYRDRPRPRPRHNLHEPAESDGVPHNAPDPFANALFY